MTAIEGPPGRISGIPTLVSTDDVITGPGSVAVGLRRASVEEGALLSKQD